MAHPVSWFQIYGKDVKKLSSFYKKTFGWRMQGSPAQGDYQMVDKEADGIPGGISKSMDDSSSVTVFVSVDDLAGQLKKIEAAGGKAAMQPTDLPNDMGAIAGFIDPAGNWVGLWAPGKGSAALTKKAARKPAKAKPAKAKPAKKAKAKAAKPAKTAKKAKARKR
jgi:predicted enzyme related to lactoylglutathione lyase